MEGSDGVGLGYQGLPPVAGSSQTQSKCRHMGLIKAGKKRDSQPGETGPYVAQLRNRLCVLTGRLSGERHRGDGTPGKWSASPQPGGWLDPHEQKPLIRTEVQLSPLRPSPPWYGTSTGVHPSATTTPSTWIVVVNSCGTGEMFRRWRRASVDGRGSTHTQAEVMKSCLCSRCRRILTH